MLYPFYSRYFAPPPKGQSPAQNWTNNSSLPIDHVVAGSFESACRLLHDQTGVVDFAPFRSLFMAHFARSRTSYEAMPAGSVLLESHLLPIHATSDKSF